MKPERLNILCSPKFKEHLVADANKAGISISELVRRRCGRTPSDEEELLADLAAELRTAAAQARTALDDGLHAVSDALHEIHKTAPSEST